MKKTLLYKIKDFEPPKYNFRISLFNNFIRVVSKKELSSSFYETITQEGKYLLRQNFAGNFRDDFESYVFSKNERGNSTYLLSQVKVLDNLENLSTLNLDYDFNLKLLKSKEYTNYSSFSVNNWLQASTLLLLWLKWLGIMNFKLKNKF